MRRFILTALAILFCTKLCHGADSGAKPEESGLQASAIALPRPFG